MAANGLILKNPRFTQSWVRTGNVYSHFYYREEVSDPRAYLYSQRPI